MSNPTQSPSVRRRVRAHRAMAMAALHSNTSLKTRIARFRHHANAARRLERIGGAK
ncbi:hypothetical protein M0G74_10945 [Microbulbifer sp. CAU 1566]|uniref:hypothetical protein n=1 Tax=Microbulbifer sp. CAU 1566 TaxID=2933269 RepID=UPI0020059ADD|nr:hypothetical protein [Microbulbifer sp. CAU 1566]MCK7597786.1 hypothetical protein [Microbulbifer sp. CAU 1566]